MKSILKVLVGSFTFFCMILFLLMPLFGLVVWQKHFDGSDSFKTVISLAAIEGSFINCGLLVYFVKLIQEKKNEPVSILVAAIAPLLIAACVFVVFWPMMILGHFGFGVHSLVLELVYLGMLISAPKKFKKKSSRTK